MKRPSMWQSDVFRNLFSGCVATLVVVALMAAGAALTVSWVLGPPAPEVTVPNLVGMTPDEAQAAAKQVGLDAEVAGQRYDDAIPPGKVCMTEPAPGRGVRKGRVLRLYVSRGPINCVVPDVVGEKLEKAEELLKRRGLSVGDVNYVRSDYLPGIVVSTSPSAGSRMPSGSSVDLQVSGGPEYGRIKLSDGSVRIFKRVVVRVPDDGASHEVVVERKSGRLVDVLHDHAHPAGTKVVVDEVFEPGDRIRVYIDDKKVADTRVE